MTTLWQDLRYGMRMLWKAPGFTLVAIISLAIGIGANTAIFSVVNAVLLRPLPYSDSDRLVMIWGNFLKLNIERLPAKAAEYLDYQAQNQSFEQIAAFSTSEYILTSGDQPERLAGTRVTASLFPLLGAQVARGRAFGPEDNTAGRDSVVIISHGFWQRHFGGDPNCLGQTLKLSDQSYTIIGITAAGFQFPHASFGFGESSELWTPLSFPSAQVAQRQGPYYLNVIARLKPGATLERTRADMSAIAERLEQQHTGYHGPNGEDGGWRITVLPLAEEAVGRSRFALFFLFGAVALVLLIACANIANLLLMRATVRQKELAIRAALGASRFTLVRQLVVESLLLAALGGAVGLLLAWWSVDMLTALSPASLPRVKEISLDGRVLAFTSLLSLLTGLLFGIAPALQASKPDVQRTLKEGGVGAVPGRHLLRNLLVIGEVGVAILLLIGAGLLTNSLLRLQRVDPGVDADRLLMVELSLPQSRYSEAVKASAFYQELVRRVEALPGVERASVGNIIPLSGTATNDPFSIEGRPLDMSDAATAGWQRVMPNYFLTLGIPIIRGRDFNEHDNARSEGVAIINETMARRYWPHEDPIGKRITLGAPRPENPWSTIIGIVRDIPHGTLESKAKPDWYLPYLREPLRDMSLFVRTAGDPASLASAIRAQVSAVDSNQPITSLNSLNEVIALTTAPRRFNTLLLSLFAGIALILAAVGIYGVMAYSVTQRTHEIGIRMALGAQTGDVLKLVIKQGMMLALVGVGTGLVAAFALTRVMASLLYGVSATDPVTFVCVALLLGGVALLACYIPARRATKVEPVVALRYE